MTEDSAEPQQALVPPPSYPAAGAPLPPEPQQFQFGPAPQLYRRVKQPRRRPKKTTILTIGLAAVGLLVGSVSGYSVGSANGRKAKWIEALDLASHGLTSQQRQWGYSSNGMYTAARFSASGVRVASSGMDNTDTEMKALTPKMAAASETCRK